jgi:hypothetical protein
MYNYAKIDELFGAPLDAVARPTKPFEIKGYHILFVGVITYALYRGFIVTMKEMEKPFKIKKM